jgi:hypothetical protein
MPTPERRRFNNCAGSAIVLRRATECAPYLFQVPAAGTERNDGQFQGNRGNLRRQAVESSAGVLD